MALVGCKEPRSVFLALPFDLRDAVPDYKQTLRLLEDKFDVKIKHGDHTSDAVGILDRTTELMRACRVRVFDLTGFKPNVVFEFGIAQGARLSNLYAIRRKTTFGGGPPSMMDNLDIAIYSNATELERVLSKALEPHFWPVDEPFHEHHDPWLVTQIRELTFPGCETDKLELSQAIGRREEFFTRVIKQYFVDAGDAVAVTMGPVPRCLTTSLSAPYRRRRAS